MKKIAALILVLVMAVLALTACTGMVANPVATEAPTAVATEAPTAAPTEMPTEAPVEATEAPVEATQAPAA